MDYAYNEHLAKNQMANAWHNAVGQITPKRALADLEEHYDLQDMPLLYKWYREKFEGLAAERHPFDEDRLRNLTALLGLTCPLFWGESLPIPEKVLQGTSLDPNGRFGTYQYTGLGEWVGVDAGGWDDKFSKYCDQMRKDGDVDFSLEEFSLRYELGQEFCTHFHETLEPLLKTNPQESVTEIAERHASLRKLVSEADQYPQDLKGFLVDKIKVLKPKEDFSKLCLGFLVKFLDGYEVEDFENQIINFYWQELEGVLKDEEQRKLVGILKLEVTELLDEE